MHFFFEDLFFVVVGGGVGVVWICDDVKPWVESLFKRTAFLGLFLFIS